ncbi:ATP-binding cassette domain-containing protein [Agromyces binzhouensis]|uniref:ATP-binding cassette domain-containing protein n=1 Tax=Agromyces binzhouensis TaxID=1817495 RepID=A0A4Q2JTX9_9MICO|nr:ATP-binding cassette domain-containing protein [Agromyces binzhouensis]RXZ51682.1 ATP-binding cassette domain-containing protein [Agromyces binzhouensis]
MKTSTNLSTALALTGITKTYPGVRALDDVSVSVAPGRVHAILGENGAGKSTLVGIAAGSVVPDSGTIGLAGQQFGRMRPSEARELGLAIVYQTPALAPALTVLDAVMLLLPESKRPPRRSAASWLTEHFTALGLSIDPRALVSALSLREAHLVEIAAALASEPSVLVLDEPTEALGPEETRWLFRMLGELLERGVAVVYITHRIPEVIEIASDLTVLRDGRVVGRGDVADYSEDAIVELIVGRSLETTFPPKLDGGVDAPVALAVESLSGEGFDDISLVARRGEILGVAGVEGNGQREFLRSLGGHGSSSGIVALEGVPLSLRSPRAAKRAGVVYLPGDRLGEAMFGKMSIRENVVAASLHEAMPVGVVERRREYSMTRSAIQGLAVKTPHLEVPVTALSGGSQQKVLLARARLGDLRVLLVEDPTQGVDAGARVEIYAFLRELAADGVVVVVLSTDAVELEGLCDRVAVFSRGQLQAMLDGDAVTERAITGAAVLSTTHTRSTQVIEGTPKRRRNAILAESQAMVLVGLTVVLAAATTLVAPAFVSPLNLGQLLAGAAVIILVGLAQLLVVITGGIDLSIGSVVALATVVISFFGQGGPAYFALGVLLALLAGLVVGSVNGLLVTRLGLPPVIATLVTSIAIVGAAQVLRPAPGGSATGDIMTAIGTTIGGVPLVLVIALAIAGTLWWVIQRTTLGRGLRAAGSDPVKANRMGVVVPRMRFLAAVAAGVLAAIAGLILYTRTGIGDPNTGQALTLTSVTAIVIAGASIFGGSGSAIAVAAAGLLLQSITNSLSYLGLSLSWQYWVQGVFVILAALIPIIARAHRARSAAPPGGSS